MKPHATVLILVTALGLSATAESVEIPADRRAVLVQAAMKAFWGSARDANGKPFVPATERERTTVPVTSGWANLAFDTGEVSGRLAWCKLNWTITFSALTTRARSAQLSEIQVAFISMLHGAAQSTVATAASATQCNDKEKAEVIQRGREVLARLAPSAA
jgi:hypothetical protein